MLREPRKTVSANVKEKERLANTIYNVAVVKIRTHCKLDWISVRELSDCRNIFRREAFRLSEIDAG